jgi:hypothetical protein
MGTGVSEEQQRQAYKAWPQGQPGTPAAYPALMQAMLQSSASSGGPQMPHALLQPADVARSGRQALPVLPQVCVCRMMSHVVLGSLALVGMGDISCSLAK